MDASMGRRRVGARQYFLTGKCFATFFLLCLCALHSTLLLAQSSMCAEVKIQIDQKVSLERQAFDAKLNIRNGLEGIQIEHIDVNLVFKNMDGTDASGMFASLLSSANGIAGSVADGTGTVAGSTTGEVHWLIIPATGAGGSLPQGTHYQVGATITYQMTGDAATHTVEVTPETITVKPQPLLNIDYFLPGNVYADDPLTPGVVEPTVPFTLGVRVTNSGFGPAMQTTIESAQPQIVDNDQGLLVDFKIIGSYVDDQPAQPSLLVDFGDIQPNHSRMGRWLMTTSLAGKFFDFAAAYTHSDALGGALTSLIGDVNSHLLTHDVLVNLPGRDQVRDFLAQAVNAADTDPYHVYESNGSTIADVVQQFSPAFDGTVLSFNALSAGQVVYARAPMGHNDPSQQVYATRSDGKVVPAANVWFSKRRNASGDGWLYFVNLFEAQPDCAGGTCAYTLRDDGAQGNASLAGLVYEDANANGVRDQGEPGLENVAVTLSSAAPPQTVMTASDGSFQFSGLPAATYSVDVAAVPGHSAGVATAGSQGGDSSASTISGIVLAAGSKATGYLFAQIPASAQQKADLAVVALTASTTTPNVGNSFSLTLQIANKGPGAANALAGITLPSTLHVLSATASDGTFDTAAALWTVGALAASDSATLTLHVQATAASEISAQATVTAADAAIQDPDTDNNMATLALTIQPAVDVDVSAKFAKQTRVLALVTCPPGLGTPSCLTDRVAALDTYLGKRGIDHAVTSDASGFRDEMRSGHWNTYWISNRLPNLDAGTLAELGMAVFRGDALIMDGQGSYSGIMEGWAGSSYLGWRSSFENEAVGFLPNSYFDFSGLVVTGKKYEFDATTGQALATYPNGEPAIVMQKHGRGAAFVFGFDLPTMLEKNSAYDPLLDQIVAASAPALPAFLTADAYVAVSTHITTVGGPSTLNERLSVPVGGYVANAIPAPLSQSSQAIMWQAPLASDGGFYALAGLRITQGPTLPISVDVTAAGGDATVLAHTALSFAMSTTADQIGFARDAIDALAVQSQLDTSLQGDARDALAAAVAARTNGDPDLMISKVTDADSFLEQIAGVDTSNARIELDWLLQAFQREWYNALRACTTPPANTGSPSCRSAGR